MSSGRRPPIELPRTRLVLLTVACLLVVCTEEGNRNSNGGRSIGTVDGGGGGCVSDDDCSDGLFCDGVERCLPGNPSADSHGCLYGDPSCTPMQTCDEVRDRCLSNCDRTPDADGDGHRATNCGGDDCDDADPQRFPGNTEVCDTMRPAHDEDCDGTTYANPMTADGDGDRDGYVNARCCNTDRNGNRSCGPDCNDANAAVHPRASEVCNGADDDCNGTTDEGLTRTFYRDGDGDGRGAAGGPTTTACNPPAGFVSSNDDCDDNNRNRNPGAPEVCDGIDNNCNGAADEALPSISCALDEDGDGFTGTRTMQSCRPCSSPWQNPSTRTDCCDRDRRAFPAARCAEFYSTSNACGSFDYNCDGRDQRFSERVTPPDIPCDSINTYEWFRTIPACGQMGERCSAFTDTNGTCRCQEGAPQVQRCC